MGVVIRAQHEWWLECDYISIEKGTSEGLGVVSSTTQGTPLLLLFFKSQAFLEILLEPAMSSFSSWKSDKPQQIPAVAHKERKAHGVVEEVSTAVVR